MTVQDDLPLQRFHHWARTQPDRIYLSQPTGAGQVRDFSWQQALDEVQRMAAYLRGLDFPPQSNIAILSKNCAHWILSDLAIWMAGHVSVPLYPTLTAASIRQILEHSEARAIFVGKLDEWPAQEAGVPAHLHRIAYPLSPPTPFPNWDDIVRCTEPIPDAGLRAAEDLATIIYTSGTTGMPKGVMHSFGAFAGTARAMHEVFPMSAEERVLSYLPLSHVAERFGVEALSLYFGFRVFFAESLDSFMQDLQRARPTIFFSVPRLWVKFQQGVYGKIPKARLDAMLRIPGLRKLVGRKILRGLGLDQARMAATGAAPLPEAVLSWYRSLGLELLEVYGMTENFALSHANRQGEVRVGYVGSTYPGVECKLSGTGEVMIRAPWNMRGYYKDPERTRETLTPDGWLHTGDLGHIDAKGRLRITGRAKEIFKTSKGKYVAPAPIENRLGTHPGIEAVCVAGADQRQPCALILLAPEVRARFAEAAQRNRLMGELHQHLQRVNASLDPHERLEFLAVVKDVWNVDNGFLTPTLKIKRNAIEAAYGPLLDDWYRREEPVVLQ